MTLTLRNLVPLAILLTCPLAGLGAERAEVFVYYSNETAPSDTEAKNYATVQAWFRSSTDPKLRAIADQLEEDGRLFQAATDLELAELTRGPTRGVFFTNRLVRNGKCLVLRSGERPAEAPFAVPPDPNFILASNPLAKADTLAAALAFVAREFPPDQHEFVLVVKSHGNAKRVITPRWIVRAEETSKEEVLTVAAGNHSGPTPAWAGRLGISKPEFLSVLASAGAAHGVRFALVDIEACGTDTPDFARENLPDNVDRFMHIRKGAGKINMLWGDVKRDQQRGEHFWESMLRHRPSKFILVDRIGGSPLVEASSPVSAIRFPWWYFVPLGVWSLWVAYRVGRSRS